MDRLDRDARVVLIDARDAEPLRDAHRDVAWARLQAAITAGERPVTEGEQVVAMRARRGARAWQVVALLAAAAVLVIAGLDAVVGRRAPEAGGQQAVHDVVPDAKEAHVQRAAAPEAVRETSPGGHVAEDRVEAPGATIRRPARGKAAGAADDVDIVAELALLRRARAALTGGRFDEALVLLDEHARGFAGGHLAEERTSLRVQALCAAGSRDEARSAAEAFVRANPASPHASKLLRVCSEP